MSFSTCLLVSPHDRKGVVPLATPTNHTTTYAGHITDWRRGSSSTTSTKATQASAAIVMIARLDLFTFLPIYRHTDTPELFKWFVMSEPGLTLARYG